MGVNVLIKRHNIYAYSPYLQHDCGTTHTKPTSAVMATDCGCLCLLAPLASVPRGQVNKSHINSQIIPTNSIVETPLQLLAPPPATPTSFCNALQVNASSSCWLRFAGYGFVSIVTFIDFDVTGRTAVVREGERDIEEGGRGKRE